MAIKHRNPKLLDKFMEVGVKDYTLETGLSVASFPAGCIMYVCILECDPLSCMFGITLHGKLALSSGKGLVSTVCACASISQHSGDCR